MVSIIMFIFLALKGIRYVRFSVYAPGAKNVYLVGDFNGWQQERPMQSCKGIWYAYVEGAEQGQRYKYLVEDQKGGKTYKADPYGFSSELRPGSASIISDPFSYRWTDSEWMKGRAEKNRPINIYEVQLSSWDACIKNDKPINLRKTGKALVAYAKCMHYTIHISS